MVSDVVFLHTEILCHHGLMYEIVFINYVDKKEGQESIVELRERLYSALKIYFKTDFLHIVRIPNTITFLCFSPPKSGDKWELYRREFANKIIAIEKNFISKTILFLQ